MKNIYFPFFFLILLTNVSGASTSTWNDLEINNSYSLNQTIRFPEGVELLRGEKIEILELNSGEVPVLYFQAHLEKCKFPDLESEMILVNPNPGDTTHDQSVAVQVELGCNIGIFLEPSDFYELSLFDI
jgi:hypothetical protein